MTSKKEEIATDDAKKPELTETTINLQNPDPKVPGLRLNMGSGVDYKEGFLNIDLFDTSADASWDIRKLPLNNGSVAQIIAYDVIEHIANEDLVPMFKEWHRVLKNEGEVIITTPDMNSVCEEYLKDPENDWSFAPIYGNQDGEGQFHKSGFTPKRLFKLFGYAGFRRIGSAYFPQGNIKHIYCSAMK
jgi:SAM-dependent methyltransferase